jgi:hypothetical protein
MLDNRAWHWLAQYVTMNIHIYITIRWEARRAPCSLSAVDRNHEVCGPRAGNGLSNALNEIATKSSPAAEIESRRCNPKMENQRPGYSNSSWYLAEKYPQFLWNNAQNMSHAIALWWARDCTGRLLRYLARKWDVHVLCQRCSFLNEFMLCTLAGKSSLQIDIGELSLSHH